MYFVTIVIFWIFRMAEGFFGGTRVVNKANPLLTCKHSSCPVHVAMIGSKGRVKTPDESRNRMIRSAYEWKHLSSIKTFSNSGDNHPLPKAPQLSTERSYSLSHDLDKEASSIATTPNTQCPSHISAPGVNSLKGSIIQTPRSTNFNLTWDTTGNATTQYHVRIISTTSQMRDPNEQMERPLISRHPPPRIRGGVQYNDSFAHPPEKLMEQTRTISLDGVQWDIYTCHSRNTVLLLQPGKTYYVHASFACNVESRCDDSEYDFEVCTSKQELRDLCAMFSLRMPIYMQNSVGMMSLWRATERIVRRYAVFGGQCKKKRKKIFTEKETDPRKRDREAIESTVMHHKYSVFRDIEEIFYEVYSVIEGPAEIPLMRPPGNRKQNPSSRTCLREVATDGIISDVANDPPGQQTRYVLPGDNRRESYRLSTFEQFPNKAIQIALLAKNGFLYTGFSDRVKCFSCGRAVESWQTTDDPADRKWHKTDCSFILRHPTGNVPTGFGLLGGSISTMMNLNSSQPMEQSPSYSARNSSPSFWQNPSNLTNYRRGGTYQLQPGQGLVIGPGSQPQPFHAAPGNNPPPTRNPPRQWRMANVISADHKRHLTNLYLNREIDRLASFGRWSTGRPNVAPVSLARAGFFYLGDMDRTQCFSCGGVLRNWSAADIAMDEHRTHFPNCRFVVGVERRNVPIPNVPETQQELAERYPCRFPMNPHMRNEAPRLETFDRRWPIGRTLARPQEIAEAGFFFLGERDRVKCWYCNGGLQNWEYEDIPWVEHAKWFPNCQFLLATKGQLFVHEHLSMSPHLPRPIISRQDGAAVDPSTATPHTPAPPPSESSTSSARDLPPSGPSVRAPTPPPTIIDPLEERRKRVERVDKEMNEGQGVRVVKAMGYEETLIRSTLLEKLESGTRHDAESIFDGTAALLDAVMKKEEEVKKEQEEQATSINFPSVSSNYSSFSMESMDTSASIGHISGVHNVSGFHNDSDDEDRDLYGGRVSRRSPNQSLGAVGGISADPQSLEGETMAQSHIWDDVPNDPESMKEFIEQKKEEGLCKICFTEPADMVFLPCSHMACCLTCTQAIRACPVCRTKIEKAIKTYTK